MIVSLYCLYEEKTRKVFYIGITKLKLQSRLSRHFASSKAADSLLFRKLKKLKRNNLKVCIKAIRTFSSRKEASDAEKRYIKICKIIGIKLYNSTSGGENEYELSHYSKIKIRRKAQKRWLKKQPAKQDKQQDKPVMISLSEFNKDMKSRPVIRYSRKNGEKVTFQSIRAAARATGVAHFAIMEACKKGTLCQGFMWKYAKNTVPKIGYSVLKFSKNKVLLKEYKSLNDAARDNKCSPSSILYSIRNKTNTYLNCIWEYKDKK